MADITHGKTLSSSDESSLTEITLGKAEGKAYAGALLYLTKMEASDSGERQIGDYIVGYAIENAEGLYHLLNGSLEWHEPTEENCHVEIAIRGAADGRFLPGLKVRATLLDSNGRDLGTFDMPFLWHPWIYHYGRNWKVPGDGAYKLRIHVDLPDFPRHDKVNGYRFHDPIDIEFAIHIKTGQKLSKAA